MAEEASSSYSGLAADVPSSPLRFTFQAGQVGQSQPRHARRHAKLHQHASPFPKPPDDKPFPSFPPSPAPAMNGMHPGSAAKPASADGGNPVPTASPEHSRDSKHALNGMHAGKGATFREAGKAASADAAAQLPPRFASAVNISEGTAAMPAATQHQSPQSAARSGHRAAARRRVHLRTPGGSTGTPGGDSPFLREGSPMDWSPSVQEPATPTPADGCRNTGPKNDTRGEQVKLGGILRENLSSKDDDLDGLHADLAASSLSGGGNKQQAQLNEAFSCNFNLRSHSDSQAGVPQAQPAAVSAAPAEPESMGGPGIAEAQTTSAQPVSAAKHAAHTGTAASRTDANGASENGDCKSWPGGEPGARPTAQGTEPCPDMVCVGQPQSAGSQATAAVPGTGCIEVGSLGGRPLSDDSSAEPGLPRGVVHHGSTRSPAKGQRARTSYLTQAAKQMKDARHHIRVDTRPGMTLKDFSAAAKAHASRKSKAGPAGTHGNAAAAASSAAQAAEAGAAHGQSNGFLHTSAEPAAASKKGQAWRSYQSSQTGTPQASSPTQGANTQQAASSGNPAGRPRPATTDLDEYLSRQHHRRSDAETGASVWEARPGSGESASHVPSPSAAQASRAAGEQADAHQMRASNRSGDISAGATHNAAQEEHRILSGTSATRSDPVPRQNHTEAGTSSFTFVFGQQSASHGSQSGQQPASARPDGTQEPFPPGSGFNPGASAAAGGSTAGKARPRAMRSPKRSTMEPGRPAYRTGSQAPVFMFPSPAPDPFQQPSGSSHSSSPYTFGSTSSAERPKQPPMAQGNSSAWPSACSMQPQADFPARASQASGAHFFPAGPAGQKLSGGSSPSSSFPAFTRNDDMAWAPPSPFPSPHPGSFSFGQELSQAGSKAESKPAQHSRASPDHKPASHKPQEVKAPWTTSSGAFPVPTGATQGASNPVGPPVTKSAAGPAAAPAAEGASPWPAAPAAEGSRPAAMPFAPAFTSTVSPQAPPMSFPGFSAQPNSVQTPQQEEVPAQKKPAFTLGQQPEPQGAATGGPAAQQQPDPGSARARGFTFGLGSHNVPPTQSSARPFKARLGRHAAKAATPQPPASIAQDAPTYSQPGPRLSIPVRCSNHFESTMQGTPAASRAPAPAAEAAQRSPEQDVERLRQRGNDAFQRGNYNRAADLYNRAIKQQVQAGMTEGLGKLHSNLAACFLQQGHFFKAIQACQLALQAEPGFHKASIRMTTCQMRLGDIKAARAALEADPRLQAHADVVAKLADVKAHGSRISAAVSAAEGAQTTNAAEAALEQLEAMLQPDQAPGSQELQRLSQQLELQLSRFGDAAGICQLMRYSHEPGLPDWHWWISVQAAFHSGELSDAVDMMSSKMAAASNGDKSVSGIAIGVWKAAADQGEQQLDTGHAQEILSSMQRMLELKESGNRALKSSQGQLAVEHYSKALQQGQPPSIPFAAVLHANRAAARQSLGQHAEAIADCLRATALKPDYAKAHSRLAALLADLKHNNRAVDVLERLEGLMKGSPWEAADVARRLCDARLGAKSNAVDHYKLLGLDRGVTSEDVRKAYKKSALQLHPDKALAQCRFSVRLGDQGLELCSRSETEQRVRDNADWLFKCIAEAHTVLTDPTARLELDSGLARQERRGGSASAHQRARTGSYRASPTYRKPSGSPYSSYGTRSHGPYRYSGSQDYSFDDEDYETYSSGRWNYF